MHVWHVNLTRTDLRVDGIAVAVRRLAQAQEEAGADIAVLGGGTAAVDAARRRLRADAGPRPDVVHFHSVFRPLHALLARDLSRAGVPYVISPHSGYAVASRARRRLLKRSYASVVERRFVERAAGVSCLTGVEADDVRGFAPRFSGPVYVVPNPVDPPPAAWDGTGSGRPRLVTLCRYDVRQKGLDRLAAIARHLPHADFAVFGEQDKNERALTDRLRGVAPPNFGLCPPVFGPDKWGALREAAMFVLASRWEGLSMSLAEAMSAGVPCAVSGEVGHTLPFPTAGMGMVLAADPEAAAGQLGEALANPAQLAAWGRAGADYAAGNFEPAAVAARSLAGYDEVLTRNSLIGAGA